MTPRIIFLGETIPEALVDLINSLELEIESISEAPPPSDEIIVFTDSSECPYKGKKILVGEKSQLKIKELSSLGFLGSLNQNALGVEDVKSSLKNACGDRES